MQPSITGWHYSYRFSIFLFLSWKLDSRHMLTYYHLFSLSYLIDALTWSLNILKTAYNSMTALCLAQVPSNRNWSLGRKSGRWCPKNSDHTHSAIDSFVACNGEFFPNVKVLLSILTTLPVSTATAERSFSTLKRIKTYLRNSMGDSRLSGLALLSIHREIEVDPAEVLDRFAKASRREKLIL